MRKRSRRRSRRRSSRRSRRNGTLSRRIGMTLMLGFLGVGGWLLLGGGHDDETPAQDPLGIHQVTAEHSPEAKAERQRDNRAYLREAADALKPIEALSGDARRVAEMAAYEKLVAVLGNDMDVATRQTIAKRFNELSERIFFTAERNELASIYVVKSGDSLDRIARNFNTTQELLCQWNDIPWERRGKIHIGQSLKYVEGSPRVVVDKSDYFLNFYFGERLAQQFIIAHGRNNGTPTGEAAVTNIIVDPDIGENIADNHREMDERWIGLTKFGERTGIGIHGTKHQDQIPGETSAGCIRMFNADVVKLAAWLPVGTSVAIQS